MWRKSNLTRLNNRGRIAGSQNALLMNRHNTDCTTPTMHIRLTLLTHLSSIHLLPNLDPRHSTIGDCLTLMSTAMVGWYHFSLRLHRVFTWATVDYFAKLTKCLPKSWTHKLDHGTYSEGSWISMTLPAAFVHNDTHFLLLSITLCISFMAVGILVHCNASTKTILRCKYGTSWSSGSSQTTRGSWIETSHV